jgi:hypothetical protein
VGSDRRLALAGLARSIAAARGVELPANLLLLRDADPFWRLDRGPETPIQAPEPEGADPGALGRALEASLSGAQRRRQGAWYTPADLAAAVVGDGLAVSPASFPVVADPACGGGAFLLAAAEALAARGFDRADVVRHLVAMDLDPLAVAVTEATLCLWADGRSTPTVAVGDALLDPWPVDRVDVVVGNPPFLAQLASTTARSPERAAAVRRTLGPAASGYVDDAALFLLAAARRADAVALVQPRSILATSSAGGVRAAVANRLARVWEPTGKPFRAEVRTCVVVLGREAATSWHAAATAGIPDVDLGAGPSLGQVASVTAGFRDEYYGLVPLVVERAGIPLLTTGLIDPNRSRWGTAPARFARQRWEAPAIDPAALASSPLAGWSREQLVPKLLVATQTKVLEAVADVDGAWLPCTPLLSVLAPPDRLWHLLAAVLSPPATAWALRTSAGSALSADRIKLSAAQLRQLPLPPPGRDWDAAAGALQAGDLLAAARASGAAYGVDVFDWWAARLPSPR